MLSYTLYITLLKILVSIPTLHASQVSVHNTTGTHGTVTHVNTVATLSESQKQPLPHASDTIAHRLCAMAYQYYTGSNGQEQNSKKAFALYQQAVTLGYGPARSELGYLYQQGIGVEKNLKQAFELFEATAKEDHIADAYFNLALCYKNGLGTMQNPVKAFENYQIAADKGFLPAQYIVAMNCYAKGAGTHKNLKKALAYLSKASNTPDGSDPEVCQQIYAIMWHVLQQVDKKQADEQFQKLVKLFMAQEESSLCAHPLKPAQQQERLRVLQEMYAKKAREYIDQCTLYKQYDQPQNPIPCTVKACSICTQERNKRADFEAGDCITKLPCGHIFCQDCLEQSMEGRAEGQLPTCPDCHRTFEMDNVMSGIVA